MAVYYDSECEARSLALSTALFLETTARYFQTVKGLALQKTVPYSGDPYRTRRRSNRLTTKPAVHVVVAIVRQEQSIYL
jgi:hypothetical protein